MGQAVWSMVVMARMLGLSAVFGDNLCNEIG